MTPLILGTKITDGLYFHTDKFNREFYFEVTNDGGTLTYHYYSNNNVYENTVTEEGRQYTNEAFNWKVMILNSSELKSGYLPQPLDQIPTTNYSKSGIKLADGNYKHTKEPGVECNFEVTNNGDTLTYNDGTNVNEYTYDATLKKYIGTNWQLMFLNDSNMKSGSLNVYLGDIQNTVYTTA